MNKFSLFLLISLCFLGITESSAAEDEKVPLLSEGGLRHRNAVAKQEAQPIEDKVINNKATVIVTYDSPLDLFLDDFLKKQERQNKRRYIKESIINDYYPARKNESKFISLAMIGFNIKRDEARALYKVFRNDEHYTKAFASRGRLDQKQNYNRKNLYNFLNHLKKNNIKYNAIAIASSSHGYQISDRTINRIASDINYRSN
ncbi:MAG: hypothetical protein K0M45_02885 [Candidatus Paracaedibacteraceae bacterium]|nr:hypothetical protein [Candidatus Paracaedibacteraceae bacterium]